MSIKTILLLLTTALLFPLELDGGRRTVYAQAIAVQPATTEEGFKSLFDGATLSGWEGNLDYFRVQDGAIVAGTLKEKIPNNEFLCTKEKFRDFELRLQAKLIGQGHNAGVQFRSQRIPNHHEVSGYQCDIGLIGTDRSIWGALYDESRRKKFLAEPPPNSFGSIKHQEWNNLRIVAQGSKIEIFVNDQRMTEYDEKESEIERDGIIGLQIHSGPPTEAWYRHIRIKSLSK